MTRTIYDFGQMRYDLEYEDDYPEYDYPDFDLSDYQDY